MLAERAAVRVAIAMLTVGALVAGGLRVWSAEGNLADALVILRETRDATVIDPGGAARVAVEGESLRPGAVVTTGTAGAATLDVRGRRVRLAPTTTVAVPDGAVTELRRGAILVDRRRGPTLSVRIGDLTLDDVAPGALRVDRGFSVRIAVYAGGARARTTDRRLEIPRLHQVAVAGRALPDRAEPLRLSGDSWEREVIPEVSAADAVLTRLARGIDADPRLNDPARLTLLPAVYRESIDGLPAETGRSEALLPVAIGLAAQEGAEDESVALAGRLRREGGSWGVVAALLSARSTEVSRRLAGLFAARSAGAPVAVAGPRGGTIRPGEPQPGTSAEPGSPPSSRPSPRPTASPTSSPSPSSTVDQVVDTIRRLLPTPSALPGVASPSPEPVQSPSPSPGLLSRVADLLR